MSWVNPFTAVVGTIIQASDWNTSGRDDLLYLKASAIILNAPSATVPNGVLTAFLIGAGVAATAVAVYVNSLRRIATVDYTFVSGENHVDFLWTPATGDSITMDYVAA